MITPQDPFSLAYISGQSGAGSDVIDPSGHQSGSRITDQEIVIHVSNDSELDKGKFLKDESFSLKAFYLEI